MAAESPRRWALFDWGGTLMSEDGPLDLPMALWPEVRALEGAHQTLATLSRRYRIGVATNASLSRRNMIEIALGRVGLRDYVSEILCYADIGARKDSSEFWRTALDVLGADPDDVTMVGDTLDQDVLGPRGFGIYTIWLNVHRDPAVEGVPTVSSLLETIALIDAHFKAR